MNRRVILTVLAVIAVVFVIILLLREEAKAPTSSNTSTLPQTLLATREI